MKIYFFDEETKKFAGMDIISDDADIPQNATTVEIDSELLDPFFDGTKWQGLTQKEYDTQNPAKPPVDYQPSQTEQANSQMMLMIADLTQQVQAQQKLNAQLVLQMADLTKKVNQ